MRDPFAVLRDDLVTAATALEPAAVPPRGRWWSRLAERFGRRSNPLAILLATAVVTGSATAGVIVLNQTRSQPLAGRVPGRAQPFSLAGSRYVISVSPNLVAGAAFWNVGLSYTKGQGLGGSEIGGAQYPSRTNPLLSTAQEMPGESPRRGYVVEYVLTAPYVSAIRVGRQTIKTVTSPDLPGGDRAAVWFRPAGVATTYVGWRPGLPMRERLNFPPEPGQPNATEMVVAVVPLDADGKAVASTAKMPYMPAQSFWQAPAAVTPKISEPSYHGPRRPTSGVCELSQQGLRGLIPVWGHTLHVIPRYPDAVGELFVSCVDVEYYLHGWPLETAVLLDARRPGRVLGSLPAARPVPGYAATVDDPIVGFSARRIANAWLVVAGGSGLAQRLRVLSALRITRLDLRHSSAGP